MIHTIYRYPTNIYRSKGATADTLQSLYPTSVYLFSYLIRLQTTVEDGSSTVVDGRVPKSWLLHHVNMPIKKTEYYVPNMTPEEAWYIVNGEMTPDQSKGLSRAEETLSFPVRGNVALGWCMQFSSLRSSSWVAQQQL